jgi:hypothetical protein
VFGSVDILVGDSPEFKRCGHVTPPAPITLRFRFWIDLVVKELSENDSDDSFRTPCSQHGSRGAGQALVPRESGRSLISLIICPACPPSGVEHFYGDRRSQSKNSIFNTIVQTKEDFFTFDEIKHISSLNEALIK